jgi:hypothetical protein
MEDEQYYKDEIFKMVQEIQNRNVIITVYGCLKACCEEESERGE